MFQSPDNRLSASNKAILASQSFMVAVTLQSAAKSSRAAFDALRQAYDEVGGFVSQISRDAPGIALLALDEGMSPRMSRMGITVLGKEYHYNLTLSVKCPIPKEMDFWQRVWLISSVYDLLAALGAGFQDRKGVSLFLEKAALDQQKDDTEQA